MATFGLKAGLHNRRVAGQLAPGVEQACRKAESRYGRVSTARARQPWLERANPWQAPGCPRP